MTGEQLMDSLELLAKAVLDLTHKKEMRDYLAKADRESIQGLQTALKQARKAAKRQNAWLPKE